MLLYKKGYQFTFGEMIFEKEDDNEWGWWVHINGDRVTSRYVGKSGEIEFTRIPADQIPMDKKFRFKWTDRQVKEFYKLDEPPK